MTIRDEEILNASTIYHEEQFHCDGWSYDFIEGAKWADQHPREGLWDVEKVEKVLGNLLFNKEKKIYRAYLDYDAFFEDLRKAMEE